MNLERFAELCDAYGGDVSRWPTDEQADAAALIAAMDDAAQQRLADARALDAVLAVAPDAPAPSAALIGGILAGAPQARAAEAEWIQVLGGALGLRLGAGVSALALACGLVVGAWLMQPTPAPEPTLTGEEVLAIAFDDDLAGYLDDS